MSKKLGLFIIVSLVSVQILSFLHMANYGLEKHEHDGRVCDIYLHCENTKHSTPSVAVVPNLTEYSTFSLALPELTLVGLQSYSLASPRAPPFFF
ncbi:MAG: hypothetical protein PQ612_07925 [Rickettsiales bacterium]|nr:hypothetical protein [Pseudomonadota bacterium]MDA0967015.1 hypothetical protein [Pseudomonadota bacterium]MDG4543935.1 hypothetical protein [Rickettsiales bacterium]MDG4546081.1 hypothetical protein [Rickettsiales bacterium]MDG4548327.1 hypothetical protein [Rickettsiales bacterium]